MWFFFLRIRRPPRSTQSSASAASEVYKRQGKDTGKRHPTIGNNVMIGAGAKVLGPFKVGENSNIAAGAVVLEEIPPNSTAVGVPARVVKRNGVRIDNLDQVHVPDPVAQELCCMMLRIEQLERENAELEKECREREAT